MPDQDRIAEQAELFDQALGRLLARQPAAGEFGPLLEAAAQLRDLPNPYFKDRLRAELQRRNTVMSTPALSKTATASASHALVTAFTPYIAVRDGDALIDLLRHSFGAIEISRDPTPKGFHAELRIGDSDLWIGSGAAEPSPAAIHLYVPDCDAAYARAIAHGAQPIGGLESAPADRPYGERSGYVQDPQGSHWYIATRFASNPAPEGAASVMPWVHPTPALPFIDFMREVFHADELPRTEMGGRIMHGAFQVGPGVLEFGEPGDVSQVLPSAFYLYMDSAATVDAVYQRALALGATSLYAPADQSYGDRSAGFRDAWGYRWYPSFHL